MISMIPLEYRPAKQMLHLVHDQNRKPQLPNEIEYKKVKPTHVLFLQAKNVREAMIVLLKM